ncbi:MAG TPA: RagB/SusD family nutrient uptake outer membrane protein [Segetibacter sp.]
MKRNNIIILTLLTLTISLGACDKFLERPPQGQLTKEEALKDEASLVAFTNALYTLVGDADFMGGRHQVLSELLGDHYKGDKFTGDYAEIFRRQNSFFGGTRDAYYNKGYQIINRANVILANLNLATTQKAAIEAQAKFFRGLAHFELVRMFAQPFGYSSDNSHAGIPLRTAVELGSTNRATVKQVYDQVIADLKAAEAGLPATLSTTIYGTATQLAAKAYLAKVYFQMNNFAEAFNYANQVITSNKFQLDADHSSRFSEGLSKEGILVVVRTPNQYEPGGGLRGNFRSDQGPPTLNLSDQFYSYATQRAIDKRKAWYSNTLQAGLNVLTKYNKPRFELPLVHLTEIKLIRAEAGAELGGTNLATAIADINEIMTRAYGGTTLNLPTTASGALVISAARTERELEMVGEGNRIQELKRIGARSGVNVDRRGSQWNCNGLILQFPKGEQDANSSFQLNPEGGCF